jgi:hypothetical protein
MHNGYFYPQDVKVTVENGKRIAMVDFDLPTKWTEASIKLAKTCYLSGWEMARRAHEDEKADEWLEKVYPAYHAEKLAAKESYKNGMSVSTFRVQWEESKNRVKT